MRVLPVLFLLLGCGEEATDAGAGALFDGADPCSRVVYEIAFDTDGASCLNPANPDCCAPGFEFVGTTIDAVVCVELL